MSGRPIISYDDITLPYDSQPNEAAPPPAKKAKPNHHSANGNASGSGRQHAHWDDPSASSTSVKAQTGHGWGVGVGSGAGAGKKGNNSNNKKAGGSNGNAKGNTAKAKQKTKASSNFSVNMSRELTHEEIWDDSALVEAWDAAMEEYEAFNGPGKGWKEEGPLVKSALWYNTPVKNSSTNEDEGEYDADEAYLDGEEADYDEYTAEDPLAEGEFAGLDDSAAAQLPSQATWPGPSAVPVPAYDISAGASLSMVSQDEAFSRALNAMYWGGYWTAVYHCHRARENPAPAVAATAEDEKVDSNGVEDEGEPERDEDASSDNMNTV